MKRPQFDVNILFFSMQVVAVILLTRLSSYLGPFDLYFTFQSLFFGTESVFSPLALVIKLAIPALAGFTLVCLSVTLVAAISVDTLQRMSASKIVLSVQSGGFAAAVLLAWPMIVHWDALAAERISALREPFLLIYSLYAISFFYFSGLGAGLARRMLNKPTEAGVSWGSLVAQTALGTVTTVVATFLLSELGIA